ncbi:MAG: type II secretion system inner membrane protein GspF [Pseudomonadota bacterium]
MGAFEYVAVDANGKNRKGVLEGDTPRQVRQLLRDRALLPVKVTEIAEKAGKASSGGGSKRAGSMGAMDLALMTRQLATLSRSGLPLEEALQAVGEQAEKPGVTSVTLGVRSRVVEGHTLADGLRDFPRAFPEIYIATVAAGESSGHLDGVLERLADYTESRHALQQSVQQAMIYPIILIALSLMIVTGLLTYVVPQVVGVFDNMSQELPLLTRVLIGLSDFMRENLVVIGVLLVVGGLGARWLLQKEGPKRVFHRMQLKAPVFGRMVRGANSARFTRTLSILAGSGVPVLDALRISGEVITNVPMREAVAEASSRVREGAPIGASLASSRLFPPMTIHLIKSGEASGELEDMLDRAAGNQEREMESIIATLLGIMQPLLVLVMGGVVLIIVIAILLPIFELNNLVG